MATQLLPSMIPSSSCSMVIPVPIGCSTGGNAAGAVVDSSEMEIEKILNEIGFYSDDYVMVHDKTVTGSLNVVGASSIINSSTPPPTSENPEQLYPHPNCVSPEIERSVVAICPRNKLDDMKPLLKLEPAPESGNMTARGRKRKSLSVSSRKRSGKPQITEVERRERNRQHAKKSRLRKKSLTSVLEENAKELKEENERLRQELYKVLGQEKVEAAIESRCKSAHERFIESIKANRVLDDKSKTKLKTLSKKVSSKSFVDSLLSQSDDDSN